MGNLRTTNPGGIHEAHKCAIRSSRSRFGVSYINGALPHSPAITAHAAKVEPLKRSDACTSLPLFVNASASSIRSQTGFPNDCCGVGKGGEPTGAPSNGSDRPTLRTEAQMG